MKRRTQALISFLTYVFFFSPEQAFGQELLQRVNQHFRELKPYGNYDLAASTSNGRLKIYGKVSNPEVKNRLIQILKDQEGIIEIEDSIRIDPDFGIEKFSDQYVKSHVNQVLKELDSSKNKISNIEVLKGNVSLSGDFESFRVVDEVLAKIRGVKGVKDLTTDVLVQGKPYLSQVTKNY